MTDDYDIPAGDTGHEPGTFLMTLTALKPFTLYETRNGWTRERPENPGDIIDSYQKIEWVFADEEGELGNGSTSTSRSERSTLFAWATGLGIPPAVVLDRSKPIPARQLIGREGMVTFAPDKNGYSRITSVVPAPKARQAAATAEATPVAAAAADPAGTFVAPAGGFAAPAADAFSMPKQEVPAAPTQTGDLPF